MYRMSRLQLTSTASSKVASLDQKIGFTEKLSVGTTIVNDKVKEMDEKFQVSEKTNNAFAAAEQTVSSAGSAIMKNRYILTGASWVTGAFCRVAKAAEEVGQKAKKSTCTSDRACEQKDRTSDRVSDKMIAPPIAYPIAPPIVYPIAPPIVNARQPIAPSIVYPSKTLSIDFEGRALSSFSQID
ncbi:hypothetical protein QQ045_026169 [Rhodiola kirilowii]